MDKAAIITIVKNAVDESFGPAMQIFAVQEVLRTYYDLEPETIVDSNAHRTILETLARGFDELSKGPSAIKFIFQKAISKSPQKMSDGVTPEQKELIEARRKSYHTFIDRYITISDLKETDLHENNPLLQKYKYFIIGSDQVWNPYYPQKDFIKYLSFCEVSKRVPFAPSIARDDIPLRFKKRFANGVSGFDHLCVRENEGQKLIKRYTGKDSVVVLDPTMMLKREKYLQISDKNCFIPQGNFVFNYFMGVDADSKKIDTVSDVIAKEKMWMRKFEYPHYYIMNPMEYLYAINNAALICTDSFHVTVFSILLHKPFMVFPKMEGGKASTNSRIKTLLNKFGLSSCVYSGYFNFDSVFSIDYSKVDEILQSERKKTFEFYDSIFCR